MPSFLRRERGFYKRMWLLALPLIWLYNGEKGPGGKGLRLFWYIFYPLHMLALYFIQRIVW